MQPEKSKAESAEVIDDDDSDVEDDGETSSYAAEDEEVSDNVGDLSVEVNVEALIAEIESSHDTEAERRREVRRRLEEIQEQKEALKDIEDTFMSYLDDDD